MCQQLVLKVNCLSRIAEYQVRDRLKQEQIDKLQREVHQYRCECLHQSRSGQMGFVF